MASPKFTKWLHIMHTSITSCTPTPLNLAHTKWYPYSPLWIKSYDAAMGKFDKKCLGLGRHSPSQYQITAFHGFIHMQMEPLGEHLYTLSSFLTQRIPNEAPSAHRSGRHKMPNCRQNDGPSSLLHRRHSLIAHLTYVYKEQIFSRAIHVFQTTLFA